MIPVSGGRTWAGGGEGCAGRKRADPVRDRRGRNPLRRGPRGAWLTAVLAFCGYAVQPIRAQEPPPVVHALLFYSPTCPHCHRVIDEHLVPMQNRWGNRLVILAFDVTRPFVEPLYMGMVRRFAIPQERWVVPILVAGDEVLIGAEEIPARLPSLVEEALAGRGVDLPDVDEVMRFLREQDMLESRFPGRRMTRLPAELLPPEGADSPVAAGVAAGMVRDTAVARSPTASDTGAWTARGDTAGVARRSAVPASGAGVETGGGGGGLPGRRAGSDTTGPRVPQVSTRPAAEGGSAQGPTPGVSLRLEDAARRSASLGPLDRFRMDPVGNGVAVGVLVILLFSIGWTGYPPWARGRRGPEGVVPVLAVVGLGVASYLAFVEVSGTEAVCGPVGDCKTVNQSPYARLFGVLPTAVVGVTGYAVILLLWVVARRASSSLARRAALGLWGTVLAGSLFSAYLTYLEPFVIGASCAWCLASALVMAGLLWATAPAAAEVWPFGSRGRA